MRLEGYLFRRLRVVFAEAQIERGKIRALQLVEAFLPRRGKKGGELRRARQEFRELFDKVVDGVVDNYFTAPAKSNTIL